MAAVLKFDCAALELSTIVRVCILCADSVPAEVYPFRIINKNNIKGNWV